MAEEPQQSKGIGELFVEFGAKGLPSLLKELNSVSASFLLTKNAAQQFLQPIINAGKQAANSAVGVAKLSSSLGTTYLEAQKLQKYFEKYNLSESLLGDLASTADMLTDVQMGIGGIDAKFAYAMHRMGLSWTDYDGSIESMERLMRDVDNATKNWNPIERKAMLRYMKWSPEMAYAFDRGVKLSDALATPDDAINNLVNSKEAVNEAKQAVKKLTDTALGKVAPAVTTGANKLTEKVALGTTGDKVANAQLKALGAGVAAGVATGATAGASVGLAGGPIGVALGIGGGASLGGITAGIAGIGSILAGDKIKEKIDGKPTGFAVPPSMQGSSYMPSNLSNTNTTININNENRVTVTNPQDAGRAISSINQQTLTDIEYSQYQVSNRAGL